MFYFFCDKPNEIKKRELKYLKKRDEEITLKKYEKWKNTVFRVKNIYIWRKTGLAVLLLWNKSNKTEKWKKKFKKNWSEMVVIKN